MGIFKKIKKALFGQTIFEEMYDIARLKKLSGNEKFSWLIRAVGEYFENKHQDYTYRCVAENYFESVIDGKKPDNETLLKIMKMQSAEITDFVFISLVGTVLNLKIDFSKLSKEEQDMFLDVHTISEMLKPNSEVGKMVNNLGEDIENLEQKLITESKTYYKAYCESVANKANTQETFDENATKSF